MPDIRFHCPQCQSKLAIDDKAAGFMAPCPRCGAQIQIPAASTLAPPPITQLKIPVPAPSRESLAVTQEMTLPPQAVPTPDARQQQFAQRVADMEREMARLQEQLRASLAQAEKARELESRITALTKQAEDQTSQRMVAEKSLAAATSELAESKKRSESLAVEREEARKKSEKILPELDEMRGSNRKMASTLHTSEETITALRARIASLEKEAAEGRSTGAALREREGEIARLKTAAESQARDKRVLEEQLAKAREADLDAQTMEQIHALENQLRESRSQVELAEGENSRIKQDMQTLIKANQEIETLRASAAEFQKLKRDNQQLRDSLQQVESKRISEWKPAPEGAIVRSPKTGGSRRMVRMAVIFIALMVIGGIIFLVVNKPGSMASKPAAAAKSEEVAASSTPAQEEMSPDAAEAILPGASVVVDGVRVTLKGARLGPVYTINSLGEEKKSDESYLVLNVSMENTLTDQTLYLLRTWEQTRLVDDLQNTLFPAFSTRFSVDQLAGAKASAELKPGEVTDDVIPFEVPSDQARTFTLISDPGFWRKTAEGSYAALSRATFKAAFGRTDIEMVKP